VLIDVATARRAAACLVGCESCSEDAQFPFDVVLDAVTGNDPSVTDYLLSAPVSCPHCRASVSEKTLVEWPPDTAGEELVPGNLLRST